MTGPAHPPPPRTPCPDHGTRGCPDCVYQDDVGRVSWVGFNAVPPSQAAVVAEDLRALAEVVPFDEATRELLELAAELLDPEDPS